MPRPSGSSPHRYYLGIYNNLSSATPHRMLHVTDMVRCVTRAGSEGPVSALTGQGAL
jgi:hypothetical protein